MSAVTDRPSQRSEVEAHTGRTAAYMWALTRVMLGFVFFWAFLDKTFGLDHSTPSERAWINGGSPTTGYLKGVEGTYKDFFNSLAGYAWVDWLFMIGLLGVGVALLLGVGMRAAALFGSVLLVFMWFASMPIATNPFIDDHLVYAVVLIGLAAANAGDTVGLGRWWAKTPLVHSAPYLR